MDAFEFASRYSNDNRIRYEEIHDAQVSYDDMLPFIDQLPERERDLLNLYYKEEKNQKDIARMFGVTQGAVSSRLSRAKSRLKFLRGMPKIDLEDIERSLSPHFQVMEIEIIKCMMKTTCQSKTATLINELFGLKEEKKRMTQVKVRHRFEKCIALLGDMKKKNPHLAKYHNLLGYIKGNLYMLHEVKLPHFDRGNFAVFSMLTN
jgi:predicted transcriptional regulator